MVVEVPLKMWITDVELLETELLDVELVHRTA